MKKQGKKTWGLINEKPLKLGKKTRKKTNHLILCMLFGRVEKSLKFNKKNGEKNLILIENRDEELWIKSLS